VTAYIAEAERLTAAGFPPARLAPSYLSGVKGEGNFDAEGLCVSGCTGCRDFRNAVRDALTAEAASIAAEVQRIEDFEREEFHAVEAAVELQDHLNLLPPTRLSELARESLNASIGLIHMAFDEAAANGHELDRPVQDEDIFAAIFGSDSVFTFDTEDEDEPVYPY
jgi:hypothetical protein